MRKLFTKYLDFLTSFFRSKIIKSNYKKMSIILGVASTMILIILAELIIELIGIFIVSLTPDVLGVIVGLFIGLSLMVITFILYTLFIVEMLHRLRSVKIQFYKFRRKEKNSDKIFWKLPGEDWKEVDKNSVTKLWVGSFGDIEYEEGGPTKVEIRNKRISKIIK